MLIRNTVNCIDFSTTNEYRISYQKCRERMVRTKVSQRITETKTHVREDFRETVAVGGAEKPQTKRRVSMEVGVGRKETRCAVTADNDRGDRGSSTDSWSPLSFSRTGPYVCPFTHTSTVATRFQLRGSSCPCS